MIALALCAALALVPVGAAAQTLSAEVHPGLLFSAEDIPLLKERIQREPYTTWWQIVLQRARNAPATFFDERAKVRYAKSLAFAWLMTDNAAFAERALEVMQGVAFPPRGGDLGEPHNEGEVVAQYAVAYDILHVYAVANDPQALQEMRSILGEEADRLWKGIVIGKVGLGPFKVKIRLHETPHLDNWHIRTYGGLGLAAMALSEYTSGEGTPQEWADRALEMVSSSLDFQIEGRDGGYAEGPFYSRYAADVYLPYLFALKNRTGLDLFADPKIEKMHEWSLNLRLPNGRRPNIDDGHLDDFYGHYLAAVQANGGVHRWDWENNERGLYVRQFAEMDAIALYDDSVPAQEPTHGPSVFMPGAGDAVFRSDWSAAATYMLLRGENGTAREHGFAHEHPDGTSFVLYAGGEMLAVDAGYINFDNHDKVNKGRNHNVVLVDGNGPPRRTLPVVGTIGDRNDAFIEAFFTSTAGDYAEVCTAYRGVELRRRVFFADHRYFFVADEIDDPGRRHAYEWRLHGNGGGTSGGAYARTGNLALARWTRDKAELLAFLPNQPGRVALESEAIHSFDYRQEQTHTVLRVQQEGVDGRYLAVLYPRAIGAAEPAFETASAQGAEAAIVALAGVRDLAWLRNGNASEVAVSGPDAHLVSDARFGYVRYVDGKLTRFAAQDATYLLADGETVFRASEMIDVSMERDDYAGFVRGPDTGYQLKMPHAGNEWTAARLLGGTWLGTAVEGEMIVLELAGEGTLELGSDQHVEAQKGAQPRPERFALHPNAPNPFNPTTKIRFDLLVASLVRLTVYNVLGQEVARLVERQMPPGQHEVEWDAAGYRSGLYFYALKAGSYRAQHKMILLR